MDPVAAGVAAEEAPPHAAEARLTDGVPRRLRQVDGVEVRRPLRPVDGAGAEVRLRRLEAGAEAQRRLLGEEPTALPVAAPVAALVAAGERPHQARMEGIQGGRALNNVFAPPRIVSAVSDQEKHTVRTHAWQSIRRYPHGCTELSYVRRQVNSRIYWPEDQR